MGQNTHKVSLCKRFVLIIHAEELLHSYINFNFGEALENDNFPAFCFENGISSGLMGHLARLQTSPLLLWKWFILLAGPDDYAHFLPLFSRPDIVHWKSLSKRNAKLKDLAKRKRFENQTSSNKHCLVTKHADIEVSGQTVKTGLIKLPSVLHSPARFQYGEMWDFAEVNCDSKVQV